MADLKNTNIDGKLEFNLPTIEKTSSHTLELNDKNSLIFFNNSSDANVTVPDDSSVNFPTGTQIQVARVGSGGLSLNSAGGVTLTNSGNFAKGEVIILQKINNNSWAVIQSPTNLSASGGSVDTSGNITTHTYTSTGSSNFDVG